MSYKIKSNAVCGVIGYGSWATALVHTLHTNRQTIWWHIRNPEVLESLQTEGRNAKYLNDIEFEKELINATEDINEVVRNSDILIVAAPSAYLKSFMSDLTESLEDKFILSATKGIIPDDYKTITEHFRDTYDLNYSQLGLISGPSHAEEVGRRLPTTVAAASRNLASAEAIQELFMTDRFRVYTTEDVVGVELGGSLKNIIALGAGISDGMGFGDNAKAALMTRGLAETKRLGVKLGADPATFAGLTGVGDLIVTATEPGFAGNTATNTLKPATLETGAEVKVPLFINEGEKIQIDTRTGEYLGRSKE